MKIRSSRISKSISKALTSPPPSLPQALPLRLISYLITFLSFFRLALVRYRPADFASLRREAWRILEDEYLSSFSPSSAPPPSSALPSAAAHSPRRKTKALELVPVGDLGYSGSTFFATPNGKFLVKSLPRRFEHTFFTHDLFEPYVQHMLAHPSSLLVRITDMVYTQCTALGGILGLAPTHHIIMENLLHGKDEWEKAAKERAERDDVAKPAKWETYDLKPNDYFFPERDIAGGKLTPQAVKDKLIDEFPDKIRVKQSDKKELLSLLSEDTTLLAENNAVDYSLFLVRYPGPNYDSADGTGETTATAPGPHSDTTHERTTHGASDSSPPNTYKDIKIPAIQCEAHPWRRGVVDANGRWVYRVVVLDFFWARHKFRAKATSAAVMAADAVAGTGPMSITADPPEYRTRFLNMVEELVEVVG